MPQKETTFKTTLIATLFNEEENISEWWTSVIGQSLPPDEVVLVDGGSQDGTVRMLRSMAAKAPCDVRIEVYEGCNIAQGRNRAIGLASHDVIAVTDAGCILSPNWLDRLLEPMRADEGVRLVSGFYQPLTASWFEEVSACATIPLPWEVREKRFMPSSRSLAFHRDVWEAAGGYPEWLEIGEDMYFNHAWKELGIHHVLAKDALVYWRMRGSPLSLLLQYFRYARGDGESGMYPLRHMLRFVTYAWLALCVASRQGRRFSAPTAAAGTLYAGRRWARIPAYMEGRTAWKKAAAVPTIAVLMLAIDGAKMSGYLTGLLRGKGR